MNDYVHGILNQEERFRILFFPRLEVQIIPGQLNLPEH